MHGHNWTSSIRFHCVYSIWVVHMKKSTIFCSTETWLKVQMYFYFNIKCSKICHVNVSVGATSTPILPTVRRRSSAPHPGGQPAGTRWRLPPCSCVSRRMRWAPRNRCGPGRSCGTTWGWGQRSAPGCNWPGCNRRTGRTSAAPALPAAPGTSGSPLTSLCSRPLRRQSEGEKVNAVLKGEQKWT